MCGRLSSRDVLVGVDGVHEAASLHQTRRFRLFVIGLPGTGAFADCPSSGVTQASAGGRKAVREIATSGSSRNGAGEGSIESNVLAHETNGKVLYLWPQGG